MRTEKTLRVEFIGRKKTNRNEDFNYLITQVVGARDLGDALDKLEEKYIVKEVINY